MNKRVAVVGAGLAGMAAAIRLSRKGFHVEVFEKNDRPGGKMNEYTRDGFRFDTGPSLLTMPFIIDDLFQTAGVNRETMLTFEQIDPICRYYFSDGTTFEARNDRALMHDAVARFDSGEIEGYRRFMAYSERMYRIAGKAFLFNPIHEIKKMLNLKTLQLLLKSHRIDAFRSMHDAISTFFSSSSLIQLFDRYATYNGSDPFRAPATLNIIPFVEHELGSYYIRGGMYRLVQMLEKLLEKNGVDINFGTPVTEIHHRNGKVKGLQTAGGYFPSDYVVCNMDVVSAYGMILKEARREGEKYTRLEPSLAGLVFLWAVDGQHPELAHHTIFFSSDYRLEFRQMFEDHLPADEATVYVAITARSDAGDAPEGSENWFVLVNMPYLHPVQDWERHVEKTRTMILNRLQKYNIDLTGKIRFEKVLTPETFATLYNAHKGSIYGISSNDRFSAFLRPANRSRGIDGLYFAGGSAHPGGGIPLVLLSAKFVADLISEKEGVKAGNERH